MKSSGAEHLIESRHATRDDCEIEAKISIDDAHDTIACVIRNMSERGAKLKIPTGQALPTRFRLLIPITKDLDETRLCELRWRVDDVAGVRFEA